MSVSRRVLRRRISILEREARVTRIRLQAALQVAQWAADEFDDLRAASQAVVVELSQEQAANSVQTQAMRAMATELRVKHAINEINLHDWQSARKFIELARSLDEGMEGAP